MTEQELVEKLEEALMMVNTHAWEHFDEEEIKFRTFSESGLMTKNEGLVVNIGSSEFQVSVVRSA